MLFELWALIVKAIQMVGLACILWGVFMIIGGVLGSSGASSWIKGGLLIMFGTYVAGLAQVG